MKVVLVDDEVKFVTMLAKRLTLRGFDVQVATNGEQALKLAAENRFDVAVLDIKMPGIGGHELKEKLKALNNELKIIFVTGHGAIDGPAGITETTDIYLSKPLDIGTLIQTIERLASV